MIKKITSLNQPLILLSLVLLVLPFLDGGTSQIGQLFLLIIPLPLILFFLAHQESRIKIDSLFWLSSIFLFLAFISLFFTASLSLSLFSFLKLLAFYLIFHLSRAIIKTSQGFKMALWPVFFAGVSLSLLSLYFLLPFASKPLGTMNLVYVYHGHNHLAEYLPFVLLPCLSLFLAGKAKERLIFGLLSVFFFIIMVLTFSRTTFLFFPVVIFLLIRQLEIKNQKAKKLTMILASLSIILLLVLFYFSWGSFGQQVLKSHPENFFAKKLIKPIVYEGRFNYWREAWLGFLQRPLLGWGWGTSRLVSVRFQGLPATYSWYTHNFYLQTLVEIGIFGFLALMAFLIKALQKAFLVVKKQKDPLLIGLFWALVLSACQSILDFGWEFPAIFLTFLVFLGALTNETNEKINS
jgi:O-antigen ligase